MSSLEGSVMTGKRRLPGSPMISALACALAAFAGPGWSSDGQRTVPVRFAIDETFRASPSWAYSIGLAVGQANALVGERFRIRFQVERIVAWAPRGASLRAYLAQLGTQVGPQDDVIVVGLTRQRPEPRHVYGLTGYRDALIALSVPEAGGHWGRRLAHELAHVFGAVHVDGSESLMAATEPGGGLDPTNAGLIALHRDRRIARSGFPLRPGKLAEAAGLYHAAAAVSPADARLLLALLELSRGNNEAALRAADALVEVTDDAEAHDLRGRVLAELGRRPEAVESFRLALERQPRFAQAHYNLGVALQAVGEIEAAQAAYGAALEIQDHPLALSNLARLHAARGDSAEALASAQRALELAPGLVEARINLASAWLLAGDAERAEAEAREALATRPGEPDAQEALAAALLALGRAAEAADWLERAIQHSPRDTRLLTHLGTAWERAGKGTRAKQAFDRALSIDPDDAAALGGRARIRLSQGDAAGALRDLERAVDRDPRRAASWVNLAAARLQLGSLDGAEHACREALRREPRTAEALTTLGLIHAQRGDVERALTHQTQAARLAPKNPDVLTNLGTLLAQLGRRDEASRVYEQVVELRPGDALCHNDLAVLYYREGRLDAARDHAARAVELGAPVSPDFLRALDTALAGAPAASPSSQ